MSIQRTITIQLDEREYEQLESVAHRMNMSLDALIRSYVHDILHEDVEAEAERRKREVLDALDRLDELSATMPPFDAEKILRESREELEERTLRALGYMFDIDEEPDDPDRR